MAQADALHAAALLNSASDDCHGVGVVQKPCIRAELLHIARDFQHDRNGPQSTEQASYAKRICNGLFKTVLLRNLKIRNNIRIICSNRDGVDDVVRTF